MNKNQVYLGGWCLWMSTEGVCLTVVDVCVPTEYVMQVVSVPKKCQTGQERKWSYGMMRWNRPRGCNKNHLFEMPVKCMDQCTFPMSHDQLFAFEHHVTVKALFQPHQHLLRRSVRINCLCVVIDPLSWICPVTASADKNKWVCWGAEGTQVSPHKHYRGALL